MGDGMDSSNRWFERCCMICFRRATKSCDYPVTRRGAPKLCGVKLCGSCAVNVGPELDHCPKHFRAALQGKGVPTVSGHLLFVGLRVQFTKATREQRPYMTGHGVVKSCGRRFSKAYDTALHRDVDYIVVKHDGRFSPAYWDPSCWEPEQIGACHDPPELGCLRRYPPVYKTDVVSQEQMDRLLDELRRLLAARQQTVPSGAENSATRNGQDDLMELLSRDDVEVDQLCDDQDLSDREARLLRSAEETLALLTRREQVVLRARLGFLGEPMSLEVIAQAFDVTRERIRQIEAKALRRLRHPSRSRKLKEFVEAS